MRLHSKVAGYYKVERVINAGSALEYKIPLTGWFPNLILDTGLDRLAYTNNGLYYWCKVGSGSSTPEETDLDLDATLGSTSTIQSYSYGNSAAPDYYKYATMVFRFAAGVGTGNISELGVGWGMASGELFSRALVLDALGNPTSITKIVDEVLDVTYQFRLYPDLTDFTGGFTLTGGKGGSYTYTGRAANVNTTFVNYFGYPYPLLGTTTLYMTAYNGTLGALTYMPSGTTGSPVNNTITAYVPGSYAVYGSSTFSLDRGNLSGGISCITIGTTQCNWQMQFNTPILKTASDTLTLNAKITWGRRT